ncbi:unnamed protein product [Blepharisma stoltei]|uniref:PiggyBac transposable element-derived protein domain-containing protein n=1 Tax=Blepharisma stoltei TaxID=1481888 RepID=A0AAU9JME8_9CILI|nr:unnamed protein product [Blepharisma stoltei]
MNLDISTHAKESAARLGHFCQKRTRSQNLRKKWNIVDTQQLVFYMGCLLMTNKNNWFNLNFYHRIFHHLEIRLESKINFLYSSINPVEFFIILPQIN